MSVFCRALGAMFVAIAASVAPPTNAEATGLCVDVRATGTGQDLGNFQTVADIFVAGVRVGSTAATFSPTGQVGPVVSFTGPIVFTARARLGTLTIATAGTVDITTGAFQSAGSVTGGTGLLRGVSGDLVFTGVQDLTTGSFTETVTGQLCTGRALALTTAFAVG